MNICSYFQFIIVLLCSLHIYSYDTFIIKQYVEDVPHNSECYLGIDLGGTKMAAGIFVLHKNKPILLFSFLTKTKTITDFTQVVKDILLYVHDHYALSVYKACIAVPGIPKDNVYTMWGDLFDVSSEEIINNTSLTMVLLESDSNVVGYGLEYIHSDNIIQLAGGQACNYAQRATINVGTGLGSATLSWDSGLHSYVSHFGRAGRLEFAPSNDYEYEIAQLIRKEMNNVSTYWNNLVSGFGIKNIYEALKSLTLYNDSLCLQDYNAEIIFAHPKDELCAATMNLFFKLLVRFVRNYATAVRPIGGLYIAGGIVTKNAELIADVFAKEYPVCDSTLQEIVENVPVYMVTDSNVSLYGAVHCLLMHRLS